MKKAFLGIVLFAWTAALTAQSSFYYPYYGKNKVATIRLNWKFIETRHFAIYTYVDNLELQRKLARFSEKAYTKLSQLLNIEVDKKTPILYYVNLTDFEESNLYPGYMPPGSIEGMAESLAHRIMIHGVRSDDELNRLILHELAHIFEYEILYKSFSFSNFDMSPPPDWIMEGFAEFATNHWEPFNWLTVQDAVLSDNLPEIRPDGNLGITSGTNRSAYEFGHVIFDFLYHKYGETGVRKLLTSLKHGGLIGKRRGVSEIFNYPPKQFNFELKKYARELFKKFVSRENPEEYSFPIGPDFPFAYSFSHRISPTGELLAVQTVNFHSYKIDLILISMKDGQVVKSLTPGFASSYDEILYRFTPDGGNSFAWDPAGEKIVFFARQEYKFFLIMIDVLDGRILRKINLQRLQSPSSPCFHPQNGRIYFTAVENSQGAVYQFDPLSGLISRVTSGKLFIRSLDISPDGKKWVYTAAVGLYNKLFLAPGDNPEAAEPLSGGTWDDINPSFASDSRSIYFSSNEREAFNIYRLDLDTRQVERFTDVRTANFFPLQIPNDPAAVVISSYHKGSFLLFKKDVSQALETQPLTPPAPAAISAPSVASAGESSPPATDGAAAPLAQLPQLDLSQNAESETMFTGSEKKYQPFKRMLITSLPPVQVAVTTDGDFLGSSYLTASDLMGDHNFVFYLYTIYGYRSFHLAYVNQKSRWQYMLHTFQEKQGFYSPYGNEYNLTRQKRTGAEIVAFYPINQFYRCEFLAAIYKQGINAAIYGDSNYSQYFNGWALPLEAALVGETTRFAEYGPNMGHTFRLAISQTVPVSSSFMKSFTVEADLRKYIRLSGDTLFAFRLNGFYSGGSNPQVYWTGGDNSLRVAQFRTVIGSRGFFFNAEFRLPLIQVALTPLGQIGPVRGTLFFDVGWLGFKEDTFRFFVKGEGLRLQDPLSSYGMGIEIFLLGFPLHFEWVHKTDWKTSSYNGACFWIGYDF